eukprot:Colp12_sorted_trinity150504_noHs@18518
MLLRNARKEARHIDEGNNGNVERIAEANETCSLDGRVDVKNTTGLHRLVADNTDGAATDPSKTDHNVLSIVGHDLKEVLLVNDLANDILNVVGLGAIFGNKGVERGLDPINWVLSNDLGRVILVRQGDVRHKLSGASNGFDVVLKGQMGNTGLFGVGLGTTKFLEGHIFVGHLFHNIRTSHEQVGGVANHESKIGHSRRVHSTTSARTHDEGDLRNYTRGKNVALENVGIPSKRLNTLLDASTTGIVHTNDRGAYKHGLVHDLANLLSVGHRQTTTENGEILAEHEYSAAVNSTLTSNNAVTDESLLLHTEISTVVLHKHIVLSESALIEQQSDALTGAELSLLVLLVDPLLTTTDKSLLALGFDLFDNRVHSLVVANGAHSESPSDRHLADQAQRPEPEKLSHLADFVRTELSHPTAPHVLCVDT